MLVITAELRALTTVLSSIFSVIKKGTEFMVDKTCKWHKTGRNNQISIPPKILTNYSKGLILT